MQLSLHQSNFACCVDANLISDLNFVRAAGKGVNRTQILGTRINLGHVEDL